MHTQETKDQAIALYVQWGSGYKVANALGMDRSVLKRWMREDWWQEKEQELRKEQKAALLVKIDDVVDKSLEVVQDRLVNGEQVLNNKTGELVSKPVSLRDASNVATNLLTRKHILEKEETVRATEIPMKDTLALLAQEFAKWAKNQVGKQEAIDVVAKEV